MPSNDIIQFKRAGRHNWTVKDVILEEGEPGWEKDTGKLKIGDGVSRWTQLPYLTGGGSGGTVPSFTHRQEDPSANWIVVHNLGRVIEPEVFIGADHTRPVYPDIEYPNLNTTVIILDQPQTGWAHF